ncbi:OadG family protein [Glaciecola sp. MF2-115]|uniref:OadG family protein n=1 Tax=Glaciecola sp. MF2-115 TaxID=3384827 RepID=UPI0039A2E055
MPTQMTEQLAEAGVLLGVGMSVVFAFLILLIGGIQAIAWYCRKFPSAEIVQASPRHRPTQNQSNTNNKATSSVSPQIAAAITAAVHTHRHTTLKP